MLCFVYGANKDGSYMEIKEFKYLPEDEKTGIVGLAIVAEMFGGGLGIELNRKYY